MNKAVWERDIHVATEGVGGKNGEFAEELIKLGFNHDNLSANHITIENQEMGRSCPIIDIHMSKKDGLETINQVKVVEQNLDSLFNRYWQAVGYWHSEVTTRDLIVVPKNKEFNPHISVPFKVRDLQLRDKVYKTCDAHFAIRRAEIDPEFIHKMYNEGLYSIGRMKKTGIGNAEEEWVILTLQFVTPVQDGMNFFDRFIDYYQETGGPELHAKFEVTVNEKAYRGAVTPPTTSLVEFP